MKEIQLTQGKIALVDNADYEWLNQWKWCAERIGNTYYAMRKATVWKTGNKSEYKARTEYMHRLILGLHVGDKRQCDHIDGNGLNNQRSNLRACTSTQNFQNQRKRMNGNSKYKGVYWHHHTRKWLSRIQVNRKRIYLGLFKSETKAAKAYDVAATEHHRQFALTNKMLGLL